MAEPIEHFRSQLGKKLIGPSAFGNWLEGVLIEADPGKLTAEILVRAEMCNPVGGLHGGVISAIMDELIGASVYTLRWDVIYSSVNLATDFIAAARKGETVTAKAEIVRAGRNIIHGECRIYNAEGKLLAKGSSNLVRTEIPIPSPG